jgi:hypothetical protein
MKKHIKGFGQFINEAHEFGHSSFRESGAGEILNNPSSYSEEWGGYSTLGEWLEDSQEGDPETYGLDVRAAVEAISSDCGMDPFEIEILGALNHAAAQNIDQSQATEVATDGGYPGAPTVDKYQDGRHTYYIASMYDGAVVARCMKNGPARPAPYHSAR